MFKTYIEQISSERNKIVVYPGRFGPFHKGHNDAYKQLVSKFGKDSVYMLTRHYEPGDPKNPFSFKEKVEMMVASDVPKEKIVELKGSAYNNIDIINALKNAGIQTKGKILIAAFSEKDKDRIQAGGLKKKTGEPKYYRDYWKDQKNPVPIEKGGYIYLQKVLKSGEEDISASKIREAIQNKKLSEVKNLLPNGVYKYLIRKYIEEVIFNEERETFRSKSKTLSKMIELHNKIDAFIKENSRKINKGVAEPYANEARKIVTEFITYLENNYRKVFNELSIEIEVVDVVYLDNLINAAKKCILNSKSEKRPVVVNLDNAYAYGHALIIELIKLEETKEQT